jgi:hypothetical protein
LFELPQNWNIPKQDDKEGWQNLLGMIHQAEAEWIPRREALAKERLSNIDGQIAGLLKKTPSEARDTQLDKLRWRRRQVEAESIGPPIKADGKKPDPSA